MTFNYRLQKFKEMQMKRVTEKKEIKKTWADSGDCDKALDSLHDKYKKGRPNLSDIPF